MAGSSTGQSDYYVELMRDSRGMTAEQNEARERWFETLELPDRESVLFELEMLLKGIACFVDPANHPGGKSKAPEESRQYRDELRVARGGCERILELCKILLGDGAEGLSAGRALLSPPGSVEGRIVEEPGRETDPEASIRALAEAFGNLMDLAEALTRLDDTSYQVFSSFGRLASREIARNTHFDPLVHLEFRSEFDRIPHVELLEIIYGTRPEGGRRAVTLAFMGLLRLLRYVDAAEIYASDPVNGRLVFLPLAAARSDGRALALFMQREARQWISAGFERDILSLTAPEIPEALPRLKVDYRMLKELGSTLHTVGDMLQLELRVVFERVFRTLEVPRAGRTVPPSVDQGLDRLSGFVKASTITLGRVFDQGLDGTRLFKAYLSPTAEAEGVRRDVWMFSQILRGFLDKAAASEEAADLWSDPSSYRFVREFITYYKKFGHQVVKRAGYERAHEVHALLESIASLEVILPDRMGELADECRELQRFLQETYDGLGAGELLSGIDFDRREAAQTLRLYIAG